LPWPPFDIQSSLLCQTGVVVLFPRAHWGPCVPIGTVRLAARHPPTGCEVSPPNQARIADSSSDAPPPRGSRACHVCERQTHGGRPGRSLALLAVGGRHRLAGRRRDPLGARLIIRYRRCVIAAPVIVIRGAARSSRRSMPSDLGPLRGAEDYRTLASNSEARVHRRFTESDGIRHSPCLPLFRGPRTIDHPTRGEETCLVFRRAINCDHG